jgi:NTE family protein
MGAALEQAASRLSAQAYQALGTMPALRGLGEVDRERVLAFFREECLPRGAVVFREGDPGTSLYIVVSGEVRVSVGGRTVAHLGPGEWVGEMAVLTRTPRSATVEVTLDSRLLVLDGPAFARLLELQPALSEQLAAILSRRLSRTSHGEGTQRGYEVVLVDNRGRWPDVREFIEALAASIERELEQPTSVVTVGSRASGRRAVRREQRPDVALTGDDGDGAALREGLASRLPALGAEVPFIFLVVDETLGEAGFGLSSFADAVLVLAGGEPCAAPPSRERRQIAVYDRRRGPVPPFSGPHIAVLPRVARGRQAAIARLARCLTHRAIGVALGSGVAYGLAHIGVLAALEEAEVPIDFVAGASMGAIVGAGYALGMSPADLSAAAARFGSLATLAPMLPSLMRLALDLNFTRPGIFAGNRFQHFLASFCPLADADFTDLRTPFRAVATDIDTGARIEIGEGKLADALRASSSAPWIFPPHRVADRLLVDGGMADPVPSETVRSMGADLVIAVNVVPPLDPRATNLFDLVLRGLDLLNPMSYLDRQRAQRSSFDVVMKCLLIMQHELGKARAGEADVWITPALSEFWFLEFWTARRMIVRGAEAAHAAVPAIQEKRGRQRNAARCR